MKTQELICYLLSKRKEIHCYSNTKKLHFNIRSSCKNADRWLLPKLISWRESLKSFLKLLRIKFPHTPICHNNIQKGKMMSEYNVPHIFLKRWITHTKNFCLTTPYCKMVGSFYFQLRAFKHINLFIHTKTTNPLLLRFYKIFFATYDSIKSKLLNGDDKLFDDRWAVGTQRQRNPWSWYNLAEKRSTEKDFPSALAIW